MKYIAACLVGIATSFAMSAASAQSDQIFLICDGNYNDVASGMVTPVNGLTWEIDLAKRLWINTKDNPWPISYLDATTIKMRVPFWSDRTHTQKIGEMSGWINRLTGEARLMTTKGGIPYSTADYRCRRSEPKF